MSDAEVRAARGAASLYFASVLSLILNTVYLIFLTNLLPQQQVGVVALLNVLVIGVATAGALAIPLVGAGLSATPPAVARFLSQYIRAGNGRAARRIFILSLGICAGISLLLAFVLTLRQVDAYLSLPPVASEYAAADSVLFAFGQVGIYAMIGAERAGRAGAVLATSSLLRYLAASAFLLHGSGPAGVYQGFIVGDLVLVASGLYFANRGIPATGLSRLDRSLYPYMFFVLLSGLIGFGVSQSDRLLAFFQTGLGNLAVYNIAAVGAAVAAFAPIAVTNALVPILGSLGASGSELRKDMMMDYTRYVGLIALPAGFGLAAIATPLLALFGPQYVAGAPLVAVMSIAIGVTSISSVYAASLLASGKTYLFLAGNVFALITLIVLSYALVPLFGLLGIAIARAGMLFVIVASFAYFVRVLGELVLDVKGYLRTLASAAFMFLISYGLVLVVSPHLSTKVEDFGFALVLLPLGGLLFLIPMRLMRAFRSEDFDFLARFLPGLLKPLLALLRRILLS